MRTMSGTAGASAATVSFTAAGCLAGDGAGAGGKAATGCGAAATAATGGSTRFGRVSATTPPPTITSPPSATATHRPVRDGPWLGFAPASAAVELTVVVLRIPRPSPVQALDVSA